MSGTKGTRTTTKMVVAGALSHSRLICETNPQERKNGSGFRMEQLLTDAIAEA